MPTYVYQCSGCKARQDIFKPLALLDRAERCFHCDHGEDMTRVIQAPRVIGDYQGYECPVSGKWIEGRRQHEENLARTGCRILEPGEHEQNLKRRAEEDAALDAKIENTTEQFIHQLPTHKRERLEAELQGGLDTAVTRITPTA